MWTYLRWCAIDAGRPPWKSLLSLVVSVFVRKNKMWSTRVTEENDCEVPGPRRHCCLDRCGPWTLSGDEYSPSTISERKKIFKKPSENVSDHCPSQIIAKPLWWRVYNVRYNNRLPPLIPVLAMILPQNHSIGDWLVPFSHPHPQTISWDFGLRQCLFGNTLC